MKTFSVMLLMLTLICVGCGSGADTEAEQAAAERNDVTSTDAMKTSLESIAQTGEMGSAAMGFRETLEDLKKTDAAKADQLLSDLDKLEAASTPAATKKIAKEMAGKL
ncbi:hypothetical protein Enr10x_42850 [Gimesia panareensis]|uniref:Uncharacterized protein n=2 Tax=Gimesia panareensis TaxID=2527978 RepID=A0A518AAN9_9PLAN|nr:hypothetical protein Enr10x_42850 [Gimesia panareensis]QDU51783.1 hypothetical protein Pan110_41520 [Gimesia panareensis]